MERTVSTRCPYGRDSTVSNLDAYLVKVGQLDGKGASMGQGRAGCRRYGVTIAQGIVSATRGRE